MSEERRPTAADLARLAQLHLDSLQAAGVEYLPAARDLPADEPTVIPAAPASGAPPPVIDTGLQKEILFRPEGQADPTPEQRRQELTVLAERVAGCTRCSELARMRTQTVFGVGPVGAELCFIGEAPGADEDRQGEPFVGQAGQLLNRIIAACGMKREEVYICNILRCRPPDNRLPLANEAHNCREYLERTLDLVRPGYICALGGCAAQNLLGSTLSIGKLRGRFHDYRGIPVLCTYHPAFLLRNRDRRNAPGGPWHAVWEDMKKLLMRMGRPVPGK
jgi:uracil-DNA glycosylase family 4